MSTAGILIAMLCGVLVVSCGTSPPKRFYTLDEVRPAQAPQPGSPVIVQVTAVDIPGRLDRQEIVREAAGNELRISDEHRWGAPLPDMAQNVLTQDLMLRLPAGSVVLPRAIAPQGAYALSLNVLRFEPNPSGAVQFEGEWSLFRVGSDALLCNHPIHLTQAAADQDYSAQAKAMSLIMGTIADDIAAALTTDRVHCPGH